MWRPYIVQLWISDGYNKHMPNVKCRPEYVVGFAFAKNWTKKVGKKNHFELESVIQWGFSTSSYHYIYIQRVHVSVLCVYVHCWAICCMWCLTLSHYAFQSWIRYFTLHSYGLTMHVSLPLPLSLFSLYISFWFHSFWFCSQIFGHASRIFWI